MESKSFKFLLGLKSCIPKRVRGMMSMMNKHPQKFQLGSNHNIVTHIPMKSIITNNTRAPTEIVNITTLPRHRKNPASAIISNPHPPIQHHIAQQFTHLPCTPHQQLQTLIQNQARYTQQQLQIQQTWLTHGEASSNPSLAPTAVANREMKEHTTPKCLKTFRMGEMI